MSRVYMSKFDASKTIDSILTEAFEWIQIDKIITPTSRIFIKPNLTWKKPTPGVTVTPEFLRAVIVTLIKRTQNITVGESEGGQACFQAEDAFESHGLYGLEQEYGVHVVNLSRDKQEIVKTTIGGKSVSIELPRILLHEVDVFITLPVPKIHAMTVASLGFKNQWGCLGDKMRVTQHPRFNPMVLAINKILNPKICIFDGTYFLDKTGPMTGEAVPMNLVIVGNDVGAASLACCEIMGLDPMSVPHHRLALAEGMFPSSTISIEFNHRPSDFAQRKFRLKRAAINYIHLAAFKSRILNHFFYNSQFAETMHELLWIIRRNSIVKRILYGKYGAGEANRGGRTM